MRVASVCFSLLALASAAIAQLTPGTKVPLGEPFPIVADFNHDGLDDLIQERSVILNDGTSVANPAAVLANLRSASVLLHSSMPEHNDLTPQAELQSEVRIRNLAIVRTPSLDIL